MDTEVSVCVIIEMRRTYFVGFVKGRKMRCVYFVGFTHVALRKPLILSIRGLQMCVVLES